MVCVWGGPHGWRTVCGEHHGGLQPGGSTAIPKATDNSAAKQAALVSVVV